MTTRSCNSTRCGSSCSSSSGGGGAPSRCICRSAGRAGSKARRRGDARMPNAAAAAAAAATAMRRIFGPKIEKCKNGSCLLPLLLLLVLLVLLFVCVAQADAAASCAAASYAAACGRGIAAAALNCASLLGCRCYSYLPGTLFLCFDLFFWFAALPHIPTSLLNFGGVACRISFISSAQTHLKNVGGKAIHFF